jgi:meso-butanediol dehydrogenase/(S,S)-butanediol dehydrogenase/diacetyl reductase
MGRVSGRVCLVTGAAEGIGRAIGEALLDEGTDVCFADLNAEKAASVAEANAVLTEAGGGVMSAGVDVRDRGAAPDDQRGRGPVRTLGRQVQQCRRQQADELSRRD